MLEEAELSHIE